MRLDYTSPESLAPVVEALIFASDEPLSLNELRSLILGEREEKIAPDAPLIPTMSGSVISSSRPLARAAP